MSNRDGKQRPRIDWDAAFAYFCSDPTVSYPKVSRQFSVSVTSVGKHARAEKWNERRAKLHEQAANGALQRVRRSREQRVQKVLELVDAAVDGFDARLDAKIAEAKLSDLPALVKLAELLEGEATDRVDIRKVQPVIVAFVTRVARHIPKPAQAAFAADLDWLEGELLSIDAPSSEAA